MTVVLLLLLLLTGNPHTHTSWGGMKEEGRGVVQVKHLLLGMGEGEGG